MIQKSEEVVEKQDHIIKRDANINDIKKIMKRQPSIEEAKMIQVYNENLKQKSEQIKVMSIEIDMYETQVKEYKFEIERL